MHIYKYGNPPSTPSLLPPDLPPAQTYTYDITPHKDTNKVRSSASNTVQAKDLIVGGG